MSESSCAAYAEDRAPLADDHVAGGQQDQSDEQKDDGDVHCTLASGSPRCEMRPSSPPWRLIVQRAARNVRRGPPRPLADAQGGTRRAELGHQGPRRLCRIEQGKFSSAPFCPSRTFLAAPQYCMPLGTLFQTFHNIRGRDEIIVDTINTSISTSPVIIASMVEFDRVSCVMMLRHRRRERRGHLCVIC